MMKPVQIHPEAEAEMINSAKWYEQQQANLGKRFLSTVQDSFNRVEFNPLLFPLIDGDVRRCLTTSFPFAVLFRVQPSRIAVIAVMHLSRDPDYWKNRKVDP